LFTETRLWLKTLFFGINMLPVSPKPLRTAERGATMVEFALGGIVFLFILLGGIEVARYLYTVHRVQHVLNELSRAMIMGRLPKYDACGVGPITTACRAKSVAAYFRAESTSFGLELRDDTKLSVCSNLTSVADCEHCIGNNDPKCVCFPAQNRNCTGLDAGDVNSANKQVFVEIIYPIELIFHVIEIPIKAGVIVKNEPFQE
jgi:hypothetical protein